ncbi:MAG: LysM peptidoglycan-binding domain-containing protein [Candidatus Promineifilaceae bacterium]
MEQPQQKNNSMVFVLVVSALILAVATYIAINLITTRSSSSSSETNSPPAQQDYQQYTLTVNDIPILVNLDLNKAFALNNQINAPQTDLNSQGGLPTETPQVEVPTATPLIQPTPTRDPNPVIFIAYTVVQGDSLYSIADTQNSSIELMAKHGIDATDLVPGAVLAQLPIANPAYCPGTHAYVVRDKDTVYRIAVQFNTTVDAIALLNGLDASYQIQVTQVICIPI